MRYLVFSAVILLSIQSGYSQSRVYNLNEDNSAWNTEISIPKSISSNKFQYASRIRNLIINPIIQSSGLIKLNDTIVLDLFNDKRYKAYTDKIEIDVNGTLTIRARIKDFKYGSFILSSYQGKSLIIIDVPESDELYRSEYDPLSDKYYLLQIDKSKQEIIEDAPALIPPADSQLYNTSKKKPQEVIKGEKAANDSLILTAEINRDTISLLIVYTPAAELWANKNDVNINNTISILMAKAQLTLDNSNSMLVIRLAHSEPIIYTELNSVNDLYNLRNTTDGNMDNVHDLRNVYCADLVVLMESINYTGGQGYLLNSINGSPNYAFSVTRVQQASSGYTTIHEIGHNLGLHHHKLQNVQPGPGLFSYSAGWRWTGTDNKKYCSVMTYASGTYFDDGINAIQVPYFSSPVLLYKGVPAGDSEDADNARTVRQTKAVVAAYRSGCCTPPEAPIVGSITIPTCTSATGSVLLNGLPSTGIWTLKISPGGTTTSGTGTSKTLSGLVSGTYTFKVINASLCSSSASSKVVIPPQPVVPTVTTSVITGVSLTTAEGGGNVTSSGGSSIIARGVCWGTTINPTLSNSTTTDGASLGSFLSTITGLVTGVTYHIRAYATNCVGTGYGSDVLFTNALTTIDDILSGGISVYPNPFSGIINIQFSTDKFKAINILNSSGILVGTEKPVSQAQQLNLTRLEPGFYILEFIKSSGEIFRVKILKTR